MAFVLEDRVVETANNPGQGDFELLGAVDNSRTFVDGIGNGNTTRYLAVGAEGWEIGVAEVAAGSPDRLLRPGVVTKNSDGGTSPINFTGTVTVACIASVEDAIYKTPEGIVDGDITFTGLMRRQGPGNVSFHAFRDNSSVNSYYAAETLSGVVYFGTPNGDDFIALDATSQGASSWAMLAGPSRFSYTGLNGQVLFADGSGLDVLGQRAYTRGNAVGPVSGGSTPTGALLELGSNANGTYRKHADGTLICVRRATTPELAAGQAHRLNWTYPAAFSSPPVAFATPRINTGQSDGRAANYTVGVSNVGGQNMDVDIINHLFAGGTLYSVELQLLAIGQW